MTSYRAVGLGQCGHANLMCRLMCVQACVCVCVSHGPHLSKVCVPALDKHMAGSRVDRL